MEHYPLDENKIEDMTPAELAEYAADMKNILNRVFTITSHDLRSPFSGLIGLSGMLLNDVDNICSGNGKLYVENIHESINNTYRLLETLFEWGKIERGKVNDVIELIPLRTLMYDVEADLQSWTEKKEISLEHLYAEDMLVYTNSEMLEFVLKNYITNAVKYSARGASVIIECSGESGNQRIKVSDRGTGISAENIAKLFKPEIIWRHMGTEDEPGTGIGLIASHRYAGLFGASLHVESVVGTGSSFSIILPERPV